MSKRFLAVAVVALCAGPLSAQFLSDLVLKDLPPDPPKSKFGELTFSGGNLTASRKTGEMTATDDIKAQSGPYRFFTGSFTRSANGVYDFGEDAMMTTCDHDLDHLHWKLRLSHWTTR